MAEAGGLVLLFYVLPRHLHHALHEGIRGDLAPDIPTVPGLSPSGCLKGTVVAVRKAGIASSVHRPYVDEFERFGLAVFEVPASLRFHRGSPWVGTPQY